MSSYAAQNLAKSSVSAALMHGTTRVRLPSSFSRSMANPRLTCSGVLVAGLPSTSAYAEFITGMAARALTRAKPMRCV